MWEIAAGVVIGGIILRMIETDGDWLFGWIAKGVGGIALIVLGVVAWNGAANLHRQGELLGTAGAVLLFMFGAGLLYSPLLLWHRKKTGRWN